MTRRELAAVLRKGHPHALHPDTDDESYINLTVRDKVCKIFESLGDSRAVETMKFLRRL